MSQPRHTARGIVIDDGKILVMERWRDGRHYFSVPGGGIEAGETPEQTVLREIFEETSCEVEILQQLYLLKLADTEHFIYLCKYLSGEAHLPEDSPEAIGASVRNRFKPGWRELSDLPNLYFRVWEPVKRRLMYDLMNGVHPHVVEIIGDHYE